MRRIKQNFRERKRYVTSHFARNTKEEVSASVSGSCAFSWDLFLVFSCCCCLFCYCCYIEVCYAFVLPYDVICFFLGSFPCVLLLLLSILLLLLYWGVLCFRFTLWRHSIFIIILHHKFLNTYFLMIDKNGWIQMGGEE
jgi:hypothetical protein